MGYDFLYERCRTFFSELKDHRTRNSSIKLADYFLSAMAIFQLKYPSLLALDRGRTRDEDKNLLQVFGVKKIPSDTSLRETLDEVEPSALDPLFGLLFDDVQAQGGLKRFEVLGGHVLVPMDGVEFFSSAKVHCPHCQMRKSRSEQSPTQYSHAMLAAVIVKPGTKTVLPLGCEPITKQDGELKNDHELNAAKRLWEKLWSRYKNLKIIHLGDALFANGPMIRQIIDAQQSFLLNVKPDSHTALFAHFEKQKSVYKTHEERVGKEDWKVYWHSGLPLNNSSGDLRVNFLILQITDAKGKRTTFSWITNLDISKRNVVELASCGRARWKIENETFNTLKNQGYNFEHNYGHGNKNLANLLAVIMMLVFLIDQIQESFNRVFIAVLNATKTRTRLWDEFRAAFRFIELNSFAHWFDVLAKSHSLSGP